jgi:hypothetical protein
MQLRGYKVRDDVNLYIKIEELQTSKRLKMGMGASSSEHAVG